nr:ABC transporter ATP-binding protein [Parasporobacterium sp.]
MKSEKKENAFSWLFKQVGDKKGAFVFSIIMAVLSIVSSLAPYYFIARIVTKLLMHSTNKTDYIILVVCMAAAFLLKGVFHSISTLYSHKATFEIL